MYKILGADRKEYGPASAEEVRQWILEGRVTAQTQVQAQGNSEWKPLSEFHEFDAALAAKAAPPSLSSAATFGPPAAAGAMPSQRAPSSGLAIASLVLGVLAFVGCSFFTGVPAIIMGHIAHNRSRRNPQHFGGGGMAIAGFVMGYVSLAFIPIMLGLLLPALAAAKTKAQQVNCANNMKQIGLAARMWANDHEGKFPPDFRSMSNELVDPKILVCPSDRSKTRTVDWSAFGPNNVSYQYLRPGVDEQSAAQSVVFQCPLHGNVGLGDGSVLQGGQAGRRIRR